MGGLVLDGLPVPECFLRRYSLGLGPRRKSYDSPPFFVSPFFCTHQKRVLVITFNVVEHCFFLPELSCIDSGRSAQKFAESPMEHR